MDSQNLIYILYFVIFITLLYIVFKNTKLSEGFYVNIPELDEQVWGSDYLKNQCARTSFNENRAQNFMQDNCQLTDLNDLQLTLNRRLDCRYYNEQDIVMGIDADSWCNLETENKNYHYVIDKIKNSEIVANNAVGHTDEIPGNVIPQNINKNINPMVVSSNKIDLTKPDVVNGIPLIAYKPPTSA